MSIPKKGSRLFVHAGAQFRWRIRKKPTYAQGLEDAPMRLAVERIAPPGDSVLVVDLKISRPDNWLSAHQTAVAPRMVRAMIAKALRAGWAPATGGPFVLEYGLIRDSPGSER